MFGKLTGLFIKRISGYGALSDIISVFCTQRRLTVCVFWEETGITRKKEKKKRCVVRFTSRVDGEMATTITAPTTTTKGLTSEETDTTNSATLSTMAASLALNNRVYSLDDFDTVATVGELLFVLFYTEVTAGNFVVLPLDNRNAV